jgi:hypothetical protein
VFDFAEKAFNQVAFLVREPVTFMRGDFAEFDELLAIVGC